MAQASLGDSHAYTPKHDFGRIRRRACLSAALDRQRAILPAVLAVSVVLAVLRGGCRRRHRCDDRHRAILGAYRRPAALLLLRLSRAALLSATELLSARVLRAAGILLRATPSQPGSQRWDWLIHAAEDRRDTVRGSDIVELRGPSAVSSPARVSSQWCCAVKYRFRSGAIGGVGPDCVFA